ncbi:MAG: UDP-galactopyranose mutase [Pseudomonadota bacterium]
MAGVPRICIVGAGFAGATLAQVLAELGEYEITVFEGKEHVAGNCHTRRDPISGVLVHEYGPHIFHTDREEIWNYVNRFGEFVPYVNRVRAQLSDGLYRLPVNLHTINQFFETSFSSEEARTFLSTRTDSSINEPKNFEEQALKLIGAELYEAFFYGYTKKQWGCEPKELPASLLKRLPIRFNDDDNYYADPWQGIPRDGYTQVIENMLRSSKIDVQLNHWYDKQEAASFDWIFYTGTLDGYFDYQAGELGYRTVYWESRRGTGSLQDHAVINYPGMDVPYTRIHEHRHFAPWESHRETISFVEYSKETTRSDIPYYPKRLDHDKRILQTYRDMAASEHKLSFLGRLGTYRYMDMHHVIAESIAFGQLAHEHFTNGGLLPAFPNLEGLE